MIRILLTAVCCCGVSALLGHFLLPVLRALKAGQSVRSIGPTWHNNKAGTPLMMGLMFIGGTLICLLVNLAIGMTDYTPFYVYALAFCFGAVGFLDDYCKRHPEVEIDYIHGDDVARSLGSQPGNLSFLLPPMGKDQLFRTVMADGVLPRKTFSMGEAQDKRYYLEARRIR